MVSIEILNFYKCLDEFKKVKKERNTKRKKILTFIQDKRMKNFLPPHRTIEQQNPIIHQPGCSIDTSSSFYQQHPPIFQQRIDEFDEMKKYNLYQNCIPGNFPKINYQPPKQTFDKLFPETKPLKNLLNVFEKPPIEAQSTNPTLTNRYYPFSQNQFNTTSSEELVQEILRLKTENLDIKSRLLGKGDLDNVGILVTVEDGVIVSANNLFLVKLFLNNLRYSKH